MNTVIRPRWGYILTAYETKNYIPIRKVYLFKDFSIYATHLDLANLFFNL